MNDALKNEKFKAKVKRVLKKSAKFEKKKSENNKISENENKNKFDFVNDIFELKNLFTISTFSFFSFRYALRSS